MTKKEARRLAGRARQFGYMRPSLSELYVFCPLCRVKCSAQYDFRQSIPAQLDRAVIDHLADCPAAPLSPDESPAASQRPGPDDTYRGGIA